MNHLSLLLLSYPYNKIMKINIILNNQHYDLIEYIIINKTKIFSKIKNLIYSYYFFLLIQKKLYLLYI